MDPNQFPPEVTSPPLPDSCLLVCACAVYIDDELIGVTLLTLTSHAPLHIMTETNDKSTAQKMDLHRNSCQQSQQT